MAELGLYLSATVLECGGPVGDLQQRHIDLAREMESLAHSVLLQARCLWGVQSYLCSDSGIDIGTDGGGINVNTTGINNSAGSGLTLSSCCRTGLSCSTQGIHVAGTGVNNPEQGWEVRYCAITLRPAALSRPGAGPGDLAPLRMVTKG